MYSEGGDQIVQDGILAQTTLRTVFRLYDLVCYTGVCCIIIRLLQIASYTIATVLYSQDVGLVG